MALAETIALQIGGAIGRALLKAWVGDGELVDDMASDLGQLLARTGLSFRERRQINRELEEVTEHVAERLVPFFEAEQAGGLPENECHAAAIAVGKTIEIGFANPTIAFESDLNAQRLETALREASPDVVTEAFLQPLAERLYDVALREACAYLITMTENLPRFQGQAFAELLGRERAFINRLDEALANLPSTTVDQALEFETTYRREIVRRFDQLQLFSLSSETDVSRYRLSVAYLTLTATVREAPSRSTKGPSFPEPKDFDAADASNRRTGVEVSDDEDDEGAAVRVDEVMAASPRLLIRGDAGSGKTTLLQWLAVNAAKRSFPMKLAQLNALMPFVVQLRRYANGALPTPAEFVQSASSQMENLMPDHWVEDILSAGRGLILIDGVDELQVDRRDEVKAWLEDIVSAFPDCSVTVTSRPPAVSEGWLRAVDFAHCALEPMGRADVDEFIDHWHAAMQDTATDEDKTLLAQNQEELKTVIRNSAPLRRLATSPLLCAMLCALNRKDEAHLPTERTELYRIALEALVQNRDAARKVLRPDLPTLSLQQKIIVLADLAYWLVRNGYTDAPRDTAVAQVGRALERIDPNLPAAAVFEGLLQRTGLLREPVDGRVDFIHRTFLEYLAALAIVDIGDVGVLIDRATDDAWSEIIVLAAGVANQDQRHELIATLLDNGDNARRLARRYQLLAIACFESSPELDPSLARRVNETLAARIPPQSIGEAIELATAGSLTVNLLGPTRGMRAVEARAAVRTLGLVGSDEALEQIAKYGGDGRVTVVRELVRQWAHFDADEYARKVLAGSPLEGGSLQVGRTLPISVIRHLEQLSNLVVETDINESAIAEIKGVALERLVVTGGVAVETLAELGSQETLKHLAVFGETPRLASLDGVQDFDALTSIDLRGCSKMKTLLSAGLRFPEHLERLVVNGASTLDVMALRGASLRKVDLAARRLRNFDAVGSVRGLTELTVEDVESDISFKAFKGTETLRALTLVDCTGEIDANTLGTDDRPIDTLYVSQCPALVESDAITNFGRVRDVSIFGFDTFKARDLRMLRPKMVLLSGTHVDVDHFPTTVTTARITSSTLKSVAGLVGAPLESIWLLNMRELRDLSPLLEIKTLKQLVVRGLPEDADREALAELAARGCAVSDGPGSWPTSFAAYRL